MFNVLRDCVVLFLPLTSGAGAGAGTARTVAAGVAASNARWDKKK